MSRKKREIDYEVAAVEYETPARGVAVPADNEFDAGKCWCGKKAAGCTGNPTKVLKLDATTVLFVCPHGRDESSVTKELYEAAKSAGLI